jgi:hypothetical protein
MKMLNKKQLEEKLLMEIENLLIENTVIDEIQLTVNRYKTGIVIKFGMYWKTLKFDRDLDDFITELFLNTDEMITEMNVK